ncbi:MAG: DUF928 domain-containing protein [Cyanobacteria bacterium J06649_4]
MAVALSLAINGINTVGSSDAATIGEGENEAESIFSFPQNFEPPGDGRPEDTRGSGSRTGACSALVGIPEAAGSEIARNVTAGTDSGAASESRIRAVMSDDNFGLTLQSHPTVFLNFDGDVAPSVMMRVEDEAGEYDERVMLPVDSERVIQGFALPRDRPELEVGKNYQWTLLIACDGQVTPHHPIFSGWVQRVAATEAPAELSQQSIETQVDWYTSGGYWYDAVAVLNHSVQARPTDATAGELWAALLEFVDKN